jgi:hypothetical protein
MSHYMDIVTRRGCRAAFLMIAALLIELPATDASAQMTELQAQCFDVIIPRDTNQLEGSILLNRCSGQTWLLSRNSRRAGVLGYRWNLLVADGIEISNPLPRPEPRMPTSIRPNTEKCFSFQGRQFCE